MRHIKPWLPVLICLLICAAISLNFQFVITVGRSMEPTYSAGDALLVCKLLKDPQPGDAVLIRHNGKLMVKRILGCAGDPAITLTQPGKLNSPAEDGTANVYIDDVKALVQDPLYKNYISLLKVGPSVEWLHYWTLYHYWNDTEDNTIPAGYVFVIGDNPADSFDSRSPEFGLVSAENIIGTVIWKVLDADTSEEG